MNPGAGEGDGDGNRNGDRQLLASHLVDEKDAASALMQLYQHHINSFDYMVEKGFSAMLEGMSTIEIAGLITIKLEKLAVQWPSIDLPSGRLRLLYPMECREAGLSYSGKLLMDISIQYKDKKPICHRVDAGDFPIMVKSRKCHLGCPDSKSLVPLHEDMGGYFILKGMERAVRMYIMPKQNYPTSVVDKCFQKLGEAFTDNAVVIRCVRRDFYSSTVRLHSLSCGSARLVFWVNNKEFLIPVSIILKCLVDFTDNQMCHALASFYSKEFAENLDVLLADRERAKTALSSWNSEEFAENVEIMLRVKERANIILGELKSESLHTQTRCLSQVGELFRNCDPDFENQISADVARGIIRGHLFVHLDEDLDKFNLLIFMLHKLFSIEGGDSMRDNPDCLQFQEVLLPGQLITIYLKDRLNCWWKSLRKPLQDVSVNLVRDYKGKWCEPIRKVINKYHPRSIGSGVEHMLETGNLGTKFTRELEQTTGMTIPVKKKNILYLLSKLREIHMGASYVSVTSSETNNFERRQSEYQIYNARKVSLESWGYICPLDTPPADQIGLLNHLTSSCRITTCYDSKGRIKDYQKARTLITHILVREGMVLQKPASYYTGRLPRLLSVHLDGKVIGSVPMDQAEKVVACLRKEKLSKTIIEDLEVGYVPLRKKGAYPGLFMFTNPSRFVRPVINLSVPHERENNIEFIGPFEQAFMNIGRVEDVEGGTFLEFSPTHVEIDSNEHYSVTATLIPFLNRNDILLNKYQCQVAKQAMGFSLQSRLCRAWKDLYNLQTPQIPIARTRSYEKYKIDNFPMGTNLIIAVTACTGYAMNGAIVLNRSAVERGMFHASLYKTLTFNLESSADGARSLLRNMDGSSEKLIDIDQLPRVRQRIEREPYPYIYDPMTRNDVQDTQPVIIVDTVAAISSTKHKLKKVNICCRKPRNPEVGDKFSSRHGLMGVCSRLCPDDDMPFSEKTGMRPDIIINPAAIGDKSAIGLIIEALTAKAGVLHGMVVDATPFPLSLSDRKGKDKLLDETGGMLLEKGFLNNGYEALYSGTYGDLIDCDIFMAPAYIQRHRQDGVKAKVRSTGTVSSVTRQPIGDKTIRFGEMERDSLLAHGAAYCLKDRLSSDRHISDLCTCCGGFLTIKTIRKAENWIGGLRKEEKLICATCNTGKGIIKVSMPYVFRYLAAELAAMNIKVTLRVKDSFD